MPGIGPADLFPGFKRPLGSFRLRSSAAYRSEMVHQFTIRKFLSIRMATSLRNIARLICTRSRPSKNKRALLRVIPSRGLRSAVCVLVSASATTFAFPRCTENWPPSRRSAHLLSRLPGHFRVSTIFETLAIARAIENQSYVIASNRVGKDDDLWFCGSSAIIDPRGVVIAAASADREELIHADVSEELVLSVRSRVESFAHRRPDLYK